MKNCEVCGNVLDGSKVKYCSNKCKSKAHYDRTKNSNENTTYRQTIRGLKRKLKLIEMKGGKCYKCGYNKNISALEFHHKCCKSFSLDMRSLSNRKWEIILKESENCILLCSNCHREEHNPELKLENVDKILNTSLKINKVFSGKLKSKCEVCDSEFDKVKGKKYCSLKCREKSKNYPSKEDLEIKIKELKFWYKVSEFYKIGVKALRNIRNKNE